jgi:hypothetical protein
MPQSILCLFLIFKAAEECIELGKQSLDSFEAAHLEFGLDGAYLAIRDTFLGISSLVLS